MRCLLPPHWEVRDAAGFGEGRSPLRDGIAVLSSRVGCSGDSMCVVLFAVKMTNTSCAVR